MSEKSYVGIANHVCPICNKKHDPVILLDKRLRNTLTQNEFGGFSLCDEHKKLKQEGYIVLISFDENKSNEPYQFDTVYRTGSYVHIHNKVFEDIFDVPAPINNFNLALCDEKVIEELQSKLQVEV